MSGADYPRERVESVLLKVRLPDCFRIMPGLHLASPLGTSPADSRFCSRDSGYTILYASPDFATAFIETVVRDRFARRRGRKIALKEVTERGWVRISMQMETELTVLDRRGDGCARLGVATDTVHARNHAAGRALGKAIHQWHLDVEGMTYVSRLTGEDVYAVFDRGLGKLVAAETGMLMEHPDLPSVLERHAIALMA